MCPLWLFPLTVRITSDHWPPCPNCLNIVIADVRSCWTDLNPISYPEPSNYLRSMLRRKKLAERDQYYWVGACVDQYLLKNSSNIVDCWMFTHTLQLNITEHHYTMLDVAQWYFRSVWPGLNACPTRRLFSQFMWNFWLHDLVQRISHS